MNPSLGTKFGLTLAGALALFNLPARADLFGTGLNTFTLDFVAVGNAGNTDDLGAGGGLFSTPYGGVAYGFRMGTFEISQEQITKATASGLTNVAAGPWTGGQPATEVTWFEAAAFVNWLNTSTGHQAAYNLDGTATELTLWAAADAWDNDPGAGVDLNLYRHKDAFYFLPSGDEWYKAAYHQNDGVTANYWDYATGSNSIPTAVASGTGAGTAVYGQAVAQGPADVNNNGGLSPYGTMGQGGNVYEWWESSFDGSNVSSSAARAIRGGAWPSAEFFLRSSDNGLNAPSASGFAWGFRVASVPEPSAAMLMIGPGLMWLARRRRGSSR